MGEMPDESLFSVFRADPHGAKPRDRDERLAGRKCLAVFRKFARVDLEIFEETLELSLHLIHLFAHIEDDLNAGEIDPEFAGKREDDLEPLEVGILVKPCISYRSRRLEQPFTLVQSQRLRMNIVELGNCTDRIGFNSLFHKRSADTPVRSAVIQDP